MKSTLLVVMLSSLALGQTATPRFTNKTITGLYQVGTIYPAGVNAVTIANNSAISGTNCTGIPVSMGTKYYAQMQALNSAEVSFTTNGQSLSYPLNLTATSLTAAVCYTFASALSGPGPVNVSLMLENPSTGWSSVLGTQQFFPGSFTPNTVGVVTFTVPAALATTNFTGMNTKLLVASTTAADVGRFRFHGILAQTAYTQSAQELDVLFSGNATYTPAVNPNPWVNGRVAFSYVMPNPTSREGAQIYVMCHGGVFKLLSTSAYGTSPVTRIVAQDYAIATLNNIACTGMNALVQGDTTQIRTQPLQSNGAPFGNFRYSNLLTLN